MNVSTVSPTSNYLQTNTQSPWRQNLKDFRALGSALQSGDISSAQSAFATWQNDLQTNSSQGSQQSGPFGSNAQANQDFQALGAALKSGDTSGARQAFATLKQDLQSASKLRHSHGAKSSEAENDGDSDDGVQKSNTQGGALSSLLPNGTPESQSNTLDTQA